MLLVRTIKFSAIKYMLLVRTVKFSAIKYIIWKDSQILGYQRSCQKEQSSSRRSNILSERTAKFSAIKDIVRMDSQVLSDHNVVSKVSQVLSDHDVVCIFLMIIPSILKALTPVFLSWYLKYFHLTPFRNLTHQK